MNPDRLRNSLNGLTSDLRSRKLLAILAALIVVAIAIPILLSRSGTPATLAALPPTPTVTVPQSIATPVQTAHHRDVAQKYLSDPAHNPFLTSASAGTQPAVAATQTTASGSGTVASTSSSSTAGSAGSAAGGTASSGSGGSTTTTSSAPAPSAPVTSSPATTVTVTTPTATTPVRTVTVVKTVTKPAPFTDYEAKVTLHQVGTASAPTVLDRLERYQLLPADNGAFASFLGIRPNKRTAVFLLAKGVEVSGQGLCAPSTADCTFLTLHPGQSARLVAPAWAGAKTFTLSYAGVNAVTSSASVVDVDERGRAVVKAAAAQQSPLKGIVFGHYTGLLTIGLGHMSPAAS
jgi:hypothetical protein